MVNVKLKYMNYFSRLKSEIEISEKIMNDNGCQTHFEYVDYGDRVQVIARTYNPGTKEIFVLTTATGDNEQICLETISEYVDTIKTNISSFTVEWARKGDNGVRHKSYFHGVDVKEVCDKFYGNKKREEYIVYEIKINPIS